MKSSELTLYSVLFCMAVILGWIFLIHQPVRAQTRHAEAMIDRANDRIAKRTKLPEAPAVSAAKLKDLRASLTSERDQLQARVAQRDSGFVSLRTMSGLRELRLTIASLAEAAGLDVIRFGDMDPNARESDSIQALASLIREPYGRPVLKFEAEGAYGDVRRFVDSLGDLQKSVAVIRIAIKAPDYRVMMSDRDAARRLSIDLDFAL